MRHTSFECLNLPRDQAHDATSHLHPLSRIPASPSSARTTRDGCSVFVVHASIAQLRFSLMSSQTPSSPDLLLPATTSVSTPDLLHNHLQKSTRLDYQIIQDALHICHCCFDGYHCHLSVIEHRCEDSNVCVDLFGNKCCCRWLVHSFVSQYQLPPSTKQHHANLAVPLRMRCL